MEQFYEYYQPNYFSKFKCDGQKCNAKCCRKWAIIIDKKTYKKYSRLKPKSAAQEITRHIKKFDGSDDYIIKLDENSGCPFLTEDNLCNIQRKHGEDFLSLTCRTYPRVIVDFRDFYECNLTLTCPVAAELILFEEESVGLEKIEVSEKAHKNFQSMFVQRRKLPDVLYEKFISIQETEIFILKERTLTLDQRLMMLGLYIDRINELWANIVLDEEINKISAIYRNSNFLQEQAAQFSAVIKFNSYNHIEIIIGLLETLYGGDNIQRPIDRKILDAFAHTLKLKTDEEGKVKITSLAERYTEIGNERQNFIRQFSTAFENYLINELILNAIPFMIEDTSMNYSYGIFVTFYKMFEILAFSMAMQGNSSKADFIEVVMWYVGNVDHNPKYSNKVKAYVRNKSDILQIMQNFLQV